MAKPKSANGTASNVSPFPTQPGIPPVAAAPASPAVEAPPAPPEDPGASFRRFVHALNGPRLIAMCEHSAPLKAALGSAWNDHEKQRDALKAEMAAIKSKALALGIDFDGSKVRARTPRARPANGAGAANPTVNPEVMAKVLSDLAAHPASKAVDSQARTGLDRAVWGAAKGALVSEGKLAKHGTRGPQVTYSATV